MIRFELDDLTRLLRACAGEEEPGLLDGDILDVAFTDLGYDSVAVLEVTGAIEREANLRLSDDLLPDAQTPRLLIDLVNEALTQTAA